MKKLPGIRTNHKRIESRDPAEIRKVRQAARDLLTCILNVPEDIRSQYFLTLDYSENNLYTFSLNESMRFGVKKSNESQRKD